MSVLDLGLSSHTHTQRGRDRDTERGREKDKDRQTKRETKRERDTHTHTPLHMSRAYLVHERESTDKRFLERVARRVRGRKLLSISAALNKIPEPQLVAAKRKWETTTNENAPTT